MQITVTLGNNSYPIFLQSGVAAALPATLADILGKRSYALITNTTIASLYGAQIAQLHADTGCAIHTIPDGERYKTVQTWEAILNALLEARLDRHTVLLALGGGVVGDITGFCAASFLRGVDYIQIPTTLLAMVDSSVGGKTAVNHPMGKNLIGAFHQPRMVWIDTDYLDTLPRREFVAGFGELFKNAFIGGREMFDFIAQHHAGILAREKIILQEGIRRSLEIKAAVVAQDEHETTGQRALLNFGHTFAHALEHFFGFEKILHGEAVLWGIACACDLGMRTGTVPASFRTTYENLLAHLPLPPLPSKPDPQELYAAMFSDKKVSQGKLRLVLPEEPGTSIVTGAVEKNDILQTLSSVVGG